MREGVQNRREIFPNALEKLGLHSYRFFIDLGPLKKDPRSVLEGLLALSWATSEASWGHLGSLLGSTWELLGALGPLLGHSWAALGRSLALSAHFLRPTWREFVEILQLGRDFNGFCPHLGCLGFDFA